MLLSNKYLQIRENQTFPIGSIKPLTYPKEAVKKPLKDL